MSRLLSGYDGVGLEETGMILQTILEGLGLGALLVLAMGDGRKAAAAMDADLKGKV